MPKKTGHGHVIIWEDSDVGKRWELCEDIKDARHIAESVAIKLNNINVDTVVAICEMVEYVDVEVVKTAKYIPIP